ncbi:TetR/AcrR family transcriptional regulator [Achromobacter deleyi]|uniref:TetR/AcrR family transcriptional regulator n=1 Tax=Achromobacter deleyi TaxID=1353891 RepID=UPI0014923C65|nr:TetR/AcrR family transcriptional regulator [Achromobacter deleyi]QVQ26197.1 TetR/AcrR family transcriptional regulator [Achromobacter deleyi]UIP21759.1 TetR/AcrR family transcriptional regulator [Achromobacter deleyi]
MDRQRSRLPPAVRVGHILDAALREFSLAGYAGARMDDIALRAGLSKGGLYAHFTSKEAVFEALLARHLSPSRLDIDAIVDGAATPRELAERIAHHLHASLANPAMVSTMRLLLAESGRVPHLAARWRQETAAAHETDLGQLLARAHSRGLCRDGVALDHPWLLLAPVVHTIVMAALLGPDERIPLAERRQAHVAMICELLAPQGQTAPACPPDAGVRGNAA